jgi:hypothetical protein
MKNLPHKLSLPDPKSTKHRDLYKTVNAILVYLEEHYEWNKKHTTAYTDELDTRISSNQEQEAYARGHTDGLLKAVSILNSKIV